MWKRIRKTALYGIGLILLLALAGAVYQWNGERQDRSKYQPVGNLYDVFNHRMHLYAEGEGNTTVVFASGWGTVNPYSDFYPLYEGLRGHVKIAVYDRFGYGYSDTTGRKRDIDSITDELREVLRQSGQQPPYVLVGHSLGSLEVIRYAQRFPDEVKGIVMVDGGSPEYYKESPALTIIPIVQRLALKTGIIRTLYRFDGFADNMNDQRNALKLLPQELQELERRSTLLQLANRDMTDEIRQSRRNADTILKDKKAFDFPLTVLSADYFGKFANDKLWIDSQAAFPEWSSSGKQIIVPDSSHYLHQYKPDVVVEEILKVAR
ncbi:alpha/beta fold hydrolase [Paenibacillus harenae]|uniref:alpha/beta fold hydrolase n=1 Tax=Paenibacillus harenae TaxID=306543 RepID=UPI00278F93A5|nr:alpha/beta hydrolase [Paenibacillus harenae]MDQ0058702.1 pimeloyl-ACP methyl ester carboxylesterase [Paenibacillus harenae]